MKTRKSHCFLLSLLLASACVSTFATASAAAADTEGPKLGLRFTELPTSIKELRFAFECEDGLEVETRWIAQNVGNAAPPNYLIGKSKLVTRGPLNIAQLSRPTKGWPIGLYRLELWHNQTRFHTVYYVIEDLESH